MPVHQRGWPALAPLGPISASLPSTWLQGRPPTNRYLRDTGQQSKREAFPHLTIRFHLVDSLEPGTQQLGDAHGSFAMFYEGQGPPGGRGQSGSCPLGRIVAMATVVIVPPLCASRVVPKSSNDHGGFIPV